MFKDVEHETQIVKKNNLELTSADEIRHFRLFYNDSKSVLHCDITYLKA